MSIEDGGIEKGSSRYTTLHANLDAALEQIKIREVAPPATDAALTLAIALAIALAVRQSCSTTLWTA